MIAAPSPSDVNGTAHSGYPVAVAMTLVPAASEASQSPVIVPAFGRLQAGNQAQRHARRADRNRRTSFDIASVRKMQTICREATKAAEREAEAGSGSWKRKREAEAGSGKRKARSGKLEAGAEARSANASWLQSPCLPRKTRRLLLLSRPFRGKLVSAHDLRVTP